MENSEITETAEKSCVNEETIPLSNGTLCVKYNKETREIPIEEAAVLAQKGLKFDSVSNELDRIKKLAAAKGQNMSDYISSLELSDARKKAKDILDSCENEGMLLDAIASMEKSEKSGFLGFEELKKEVPGIEDISQLPQEIVENASLNGRNLFDEYLRYEFKQAKEKSESRRASVAAAGQSIGSQTKKDDGDFDPVSARFLKGLWGK